MGGMQVAHTVTKAGAVIGFYLQDTRQWLWPTSAFGGQLTPAHATWSYSRCSCGQGPAVSSVQRMNLLWWSPHLMFPQPWCLASLAAPVFFPCTLDWGPPHISAVCTQLIPVLSLGMTLKPESTQWTSVSCQEGAPTSVSVLRRGHQPSEHISLHFAPCKPVAVRSSKALKLLLHPSWSPHQQGDFPGYGNLSFIPASSRECRFRPDFLLFILSFVPPSYMDIFTPFGSLKSPASVYRCSVRIVPHVDAFLMQVCNTPPRSWAPHRCSVLIPNPRCTLVPSSLLLLYNSNIWKHILVLTYIDNST